MAQAWRKGDIAPNAILNNFELSARDFERVKNEILSKKTFEKRKKIPGLDESRADIIPAGIIILAALFEMLDLKSIIISGYALRRELSSTRSKNYTPICRTSHRRRSEPVRYPQ